MDKHYVAKILNEIGLLLELKGENPFKSRAYYNGARIIESLSEDLTTLIDENRLGTIEGIGKALEEKITTLVITGELVYYSELKKTFPEGLFELFTIPGLGPKKIKSLFDSLGIQSLGELEYACIENRLVELKGFGKKSQDKILEAISYCKQHSSHRLFHEALMEAHEILSYLRDMDGIKKAQIAGSIRRRKELIKDIDILITSPIEDILEKISILEILPEVVSLGPQKGSFRTRLKTPVDIRLIEDNAYYTALHHFTGSKEHNTELRHYAKSKGMKINEYGIFYEGEEDGTAQISSEEAFFKLLGLQYIPPELREGMGELDAALKGEIPQLIEEKDIKGVLHNHTTYSDGTNTLEEMVKKATTLSFEYFGTGDHSKSAFYAGGLTIDKVKEQWMEIEMLQQKYPDIKLLKGIESEILADGSLDYPAEILEGFDYVVASVHSSFNMDSERMTARIIKAVENPYTTMLGHMTGRLLMAREGYRLDIPRILRACVDNKVIVEINGSPHRLDLDWRWVKVGREMGVRFSINPDAHSVGALEHFRHGVNVARKGWLSPKEVLNTLDVNKLLLVIKKSF
jgi:DNA polymerase (family 10)